MPDARRARRHLLAHRHLLARRHHADDDPLAALRAVGAEGRSATAALFRDGRLELEYHEGEGYRARFVDPDDDRS